MLASSSIALGEVHVELARQQRLRGGVGEGRAVGEPAGQLGRPRRERIVLDELGGQADRPSPAPRSPCRRASAARVARPSPTMRGSRYAEPMSAPASPTRVKRNAKDADRLIRRKSLASASTEPGAGRDAVDRGDDRQWARPACAANGRAGHAGESEQLGGLHLLQLADDLLDVAARAEAAPLAGEHDDAGVVRAAAARANRSRRSA